MCKLSKKIKLNFQNKRLNAIVKYIQRKQHKIIAMHPKCISRLDNVNDITNLFAKQNKILFEITHKYNMLIHRENDFFGFNKFY